MLSKTSTPRLLQCPQRSTGNDPPRTRQVAFRNFSICASGPGCLAAFSHCCSSSASVRSGSPAINRSMIWGVIAILGVLEGAGADRDRAAGGWGPAGLARVAEARVLGIVDGVRFSALGAARGVAGRPSGLGAEGSSAPCGAACFGGATGGPPRAPAHISDSRKQPVSNANNSFKTSIHHAHHPACRRFVHQKCAREFHPVEANRYCRS